MKGGPLEDDLPGIHSKPCFSNVKTCNLKVQYVQIIQNCIFKYDNPIPNRFLAP